MKEDNSAGKTGVLVTTLFASIILMFQLSKCAETRYLMRVARFFKGSCASAWCLRLLLRRCALVLFHHLAHLPLETRVHRRHEIAPSEHVLSGRRSGFTPSVIEVVALGHAMVPLEGVVYVSQGVGSRVERREHLAIRETVPCDRVAADPRLDLKPVGFQVQQVVREDIAAAVATALLVVATNAFGDSRAIRESDFFVLVGPAEVRRLACHHNKLPQALHRGVDRPEHWVQRRARLIDAVE